MQPNIKLPFHYYVKVIIKIPDFMGILGCIKKLNRFFKIVFSKGSDLGFNFWYTVNVKLPYSHFFYCSKQCKTPFFIIPNLKRFTQPAYFL